MVWYIPNVIKEVSRELRKNMTESEGKIWLEIKNMKLGYKFLRQKPIYLYSENNWQERYIIPDFCCFELKLIIEIDWNIHDKIEICILDRIKEELIKQKWFSIIRIQNQDIKNNINNVIKKIVASFP